MTKLLIADPDTATNEGLGNLLAACGADICTETDGIRALQRSLDEDFDVVVAEVHLPGLDGLSLLQQVREHKPETAVILLTAFGTVEDAVDAMRRGAADFLSKPYTQEQIRLSVERSLEHAALIRQNRELRDALDDRVHLDNLVASDPVMAKITKTVRAVAPSRATVLLTGESGSGKTLLARSLHSLSKRATEPFIEVNCGALPDNLLESELFGHVRGAFTGAVQDRPGKFEAAHGGTIFLDEVATASPSLQVKLLRVLQDRVIERVGDTATIEVDVRVILATNQDLEQAVRDGKFREDLYYRIHVVSIEMPPLRQRTADIPLLARHFLLRIAKENEKPITRIHPSAMRALCHAPLPGNVRQLENIIERAVVLCEGTEVTLQDLPADLHNQAVGPDDPLELVANAPAVVPLKEAMAEPEKAILQRALAAHGGNRQATAAALEINRSTLFNKMRKYGLL